VLAEGLFLDLGRADFVLDRSLERERFRDHVTRGLTWRVLRTGAVRGLGISRPGTYYYTLYALEPPSAYGAAPRPRPGAWPAGDEAARCIVPGCPGVRRAEPTAIMERHAVLPGVS
jgi:hypothetical protein